MLRSQSDIPSIANSANVTTDRAKIVSSCSDRTWSAEAGSTQGGGKIEVVDPSVSVQLDKATDKGTVVVVGGSACAGDVEMDAAEVNASSSTSSRLRSRAGPVAVLIRYPQRCEELAGATEHRPEADEHCRQQEQSDDSAGDFGSHRLRPERSCEAGHLAEPLRQHLDGLCDLFGVALGEAPPHQAVASVMAPVASSVRIDRHL